MRKVVLVLSAAAVAAVVLWSLPVGAQGDIRVVWPAASIRSTFTDLGEPGLRLGDRLTSRGPLFDTAGSEVGTAHQDCVVMRRITDGPEGPGGLYRCTYILHLADGDILVEGLDPHGPGVYRMGVLGGTGAYAGASGDATLTDTFTETEFAIVLPR
jgi:hypothetical protein